MGWTATVSQSWIHYTNLGNSLSYDTISVYLDTNSTKNPRTGRITFRVGNVTKALEISQARNG
ncbi:MAG: hypothetical protein LBT54_04305 [Bifidobacteriaceae bacterium]|nr:hypothetical protein [Bifidobacteriaceae bacterium]